MLTAWWYSDTIRLGCLPSQAGRRFPFVYQEEHSEHLWGLYRAGLPPAHSTESDMDFFKHLHWLCLSLPGRFQTEPTLTGWNISFQDSRGLRCMPILAGSWRY